MAEIAQIKRKMVEFLKKYNHVGVAQIYPWRPHAAQRDYLLRLARNAGYETSELVCNGSLTHCYDKQYHTLGWGGVDHCIKCRLGRAKERDTTGNFALDWSMRHQPVLGEQEAILSSVAAIVRAELPIDILEQDIDVGILHAYRVGYHSARRWISEFGVDLIMLFNGRIDILKGVADAASAANVDFVSYERSWFGDGLMLIPNENCLGLEHIHQLGRASGTMTLTAAETAKAEGIIRRRVERLGSNEWRDFQVQGKDQVTDAADLSDDPIEILVLPSSMYEIWGHPDWRTGWRDNFEALDWLKEKLGVPWSRWVIRGHPIWAQRVGKNLGTNAERHYQDFCAARGVRYVKASSPINTPDLVERADMVVVNGGSSVIDAIWRGKPVISLSQSVYNHWGLCATSLSHGGSIDIPDDTSRRLQLVRFIHSMDRLIPSYVNHAVSASSAEQVFYDGASFEEIVNLLHQHTLMPAGKNEAQVGDQIIWKPSIADNFRKFFRTGDA
jgi:hypothetical protein